MGVYVNGSNGPLRTELPNDNTIVPGLNLSWSKLMLLADDFLSHGDPGDPANNGVLELPKPLIDINALTGELQVIQNQYMKTSIDGQKSMLQLHRDQRVESMNSAIKAIQSFVDNTLKALEDQKKESAANWCKAVFGLIGSVLAAVAMTGLSGGAAAVAGVGVIVGAVMALLEVANQAVHTAGLKVQGPDGKEKAMDISIAAGIQRIVENDPATKGLTAEQKADVVSKATTAVTVILMLVVIAGGMACAEGVIVPAASAMKTVLNGEKSAAEAWAGLKEAIREGGDEAASQLEVIAEVLAQVADAGTAASDITVASFKIRVAGAERDANNAKSTGDLWNAIAQYVARYVERDGDNLKDTTSRYTRMQSEIFDMIKDYFSAQQEVHALS